MATAAQRTNAKYDKIWEKATAIKASAVSIKNPWFRKDGPYSRQTYEIQGEPVFQHRGVSVYRRSQSWLYVLGDTAITERAGFNKDAGAGVIDGILDGLEPSADAVVLHLRANGHKALSYDEYGIEYRAGRMA